MSTFDFADRPAVTEAEILAIAMQLKRQATRWLQLHRQQVAGNRDRDYELPFSALGSTDFAACRRLLDSKSYPVQLVGGRRAADPASSTVCHMRQRLFFVTCFFFLVGIGLLLRNLRQRRRD